MRNHELVDISTGEVIPAVTWIRKKWKGETFIMVFQTAFETLAKDKEITLEAKNVLLYLFSKLDFENYLLIPQVDIAKELGMQKQNVNRAIRILVQKGILLEGPKVDRSRGYRLNHNWGWKGTLKNLRVLRAAETRS